MGFDRREHAKPYVRRDGDNLQRIAERETATGNPLTWQQIARFNWGTDEPREVDAYLRDELGCRRRDAANRYVISADDEPRGELLIPVPFRKEDLKLEKTYTIRVQRKRCPDQFVACCSLPGVTFAFNSSFVRPAVVEHLQALAALARANPAAKIMIFGHTDAVGDALYNKKLSERRAWSVHAFVTNDADAWETLYNHDDEAWGVPVLQEILADLGHDPGPADGDWGPQTRAAARAFLGLPDDAPVENDASFRARLFAAYMASKHDVDLPRSRFLEPGYMGCGEFNPIETTEEAHEANRRVTFFLFHPDRVPNLPCAFADVGPCERQMVSVGRRHKASFRCSFYDSWARSCPGEGPVQVLPQVYLLDPEGMAIPNARWRARAGGSTVGEGTADGSGLATLPSNSLPDVVEIQWAPPNGGTPGSDGFPYTHEYFVRMPGAAEQACQEMLSNLGFDRFDDIAQNVAEFQQELGLRITGAHQDIAELLEQWHGTGNRPAAAVPPPEDGADGGGAETAARGAEDATPSDDEGEPLDPEDVLDCDHDD
jgi:outer membrane protein OmpA-like peptidoglycan-associated protein